MDRQDSIRSGRKILSGFMKLKSLSAFFAIALTANGLDAQSSFFQQEPTPIPRSTQVRYPEIPLQSPSLIPSQSGQVQLSLSESLLREVLQRQSQQSGPVHDFLMGATINGQQTTFTRVDIDCRESPQQAMMDMILTGTVDTATTATTPQAAILQQGRNQFVAIKPILFDGQKILTRQARVQVYPNQMIMGARSRYSQVPLIGPFADRMAFGIAQSRLPQSNVVAAQRLHQRLQPELNTQIDQRLVPLNQQINKQHWSLLKQLNLIPEEFGTSSTTDHLLIALDYQPQSTREPKIIPENQRRADLCWAVHESLYETLADRFQLAGQTVSLNEFSRDFDQFLSAVSVSPDSGRPRLPVDIIFTFSDSQPVVAKFRDGKISVLIHGQFEAQDVTKTGEKQIELVFEIRFQESEFEIITTDIRVHSLNPDRTSKKMGMVDYVIREQLRSQMVPLKFRKVFHIVPNDRKAVSLVIQSIETKDGWSTLKLSRDVHRDTLDNHPTPMPKLRTGFGSGF